MNSAVDLIRSFRQLHVLVIGDAMLDTYLEGTATRLCREGPVPVVSKRAERNIPGGAANTAVNLRTLGAEVIFLAIVGRNTVGALLKSALREQGVDDRWIVEDESAHTLHKLRILADGHYIVRADQDACYDSRKSQEQMLANLEEVFARCNLVVISDYGYGTASDALIEQVRKLRSLHPCPLLVDSKNLRRFNGLRATVVTPSFEEVRALFDPGRVTKSPLAGSSLDNAGVEELGRRLLAMIDAEYAAITMAGDGVVLFGRQGTMRHIPTYRVAPANDVGAGDSFTAAMALAIGAGGTVEEAARIANDAASIAVTRPWTASVSYQELLRRVSLREHTTRSTHRVEQVGSPQALEHLLAELEIKRLDGRTIVFTNGVFDILHAGHVEFLRQAKALGDVLIVAINSDYSARRLKGEKRPINSEGDRMALVAALDPVDHVVLFDEETPAGMIRLMRPHIHVKGGDYADEALPESEAVREVGGRVVILPLAGSISTSSVIDRIIALMTAPDDQTEVTK
jgi:D-beta-D-heptose 7-phosphate kinase/D-beta-D-heptose 1-phosphate adenosyltransferase